jgi:hypothetical protein
VLVPGMSGQISGRKDHFSVGPVAADFAPINEARS